MERKKTDANELKLLGNDNDFLKLNTHDYVLICMLENLELKAKAPELD